MQINEKVQSLIKERKEQMLHESIALKEQYRDYAEGIVAGYQQRYNRPIDESVLLTTLQALQNFTTQELINETTTTANVGTFADYGYQLISATLPNLVTNEIASLQPLKIRTGTIWYLSYEFLNAKGNMPALTKGLDAKLGIPDYIHVTDQTSYQEPVATGTGTTTSFTFVLALNPVTAGTAVITAGSVVATDDGADGFTGSGINTGASSISYTSGQVTIVFSVAPAYGLAITCTYDFNYEADPENNINEVDIILAQDSVTATQHKLRARYSLDAAFDLQQVQGVNADDLLVASLASFIRSDIDRTVMADIYAQATANSSMGTLSFSAAVPTYIPLKAHYDSFKSKILIHGNNKIFQRTKMVGANFIIAGTNVCTVIESIDGFESATTLTGSFSGPHICGTLNGFKIIKNPHFGADTFVMGHKGGDYLNCGYVFAPYRALYLTPTIVLDDDKGRRGMAMSAGKKMVNVDMFCAGVITSFS